MLDLCDQEDARDIADTLHHLARGFEELAKRQDSAAAYTALMKKCEPWWDMAQLSSSQP